eukprot:7091628-Pyramimonas_sp.AAC.1
MLEPWGKSRGVFGGLQKIPRAPNVSPRGPIRHRSKRALALTVGGRPLAHTRVAADPAPRC